jgi:beta-glucosidase
MKKVRIRLFGILISMCLSALICTCGNSPCSHTDAGTHYENSQAAFDTRADDLLSRMTLEEKIGQMAQVEKNSVNRDHITTMFIGSIFNTGGGYPSPNTPEAWADMIDGLQRRALETRLGIPLLYAVDAAHGHNNVKGTVIFPHNIGLGSANDCDLMECIGRITAVELSATGVYWNFAPVVAVAQDIRWGRTYEAYSENTETVSRLSAAYIRGLQNTGSSGLGTFSTVLATPKHYLADGATQWGTAEMFIIKQFMIDKGVSNADEAVLRSIHLPPYKAAIAEGAHCIMVSYSDWKHTAMHAHKYLLIDVLKGELGFKGLLVSDWGAIDQLPGDYYRNVVTSINAGLDMIMLRHDYTVFISTLKKAVENGDVPMKRIDDAVRRILSAKFRLGLFERPFAERELLAKVGSHDHREVAREAVRKSLVLLKNNRGLLPLSKNITHLFVAGKAADDIGIQCGGWTIEWQGKPGKITEGTTILEGIRDALPPRTKLSYNQYAQFDDEHMKAEVGIVVVGETPYAEGVGDKGDLSLSTGDVRLITKMKKRCDSLVLIIISGRPLIITDIIDMCDAVVAAWLPGTEGRGIADVLLGDYGFSGKLPFAWPRSMDQIPCSRITSDSALFPFGYGLK